MSHDPRPSITCPRCGAVSVNPYDIRERYCGWCHQFHEFFQPAERVLTRAEIAAQHKGSRRIAPGLWLDARGAAHWSVPELLEYFELPDTPANRARVTEMLEELARAHGVVVVRQHEES